MHAATGMIIMNILEDRVARRNRLIKSPYWRIGLHVATDLFKSRHTYIYIYWGIGLHAVTDLIKMNILEERVARRNRTECEYIVRAGCTLQQN